MIFEALKDLIIQAKKNFSLNVIGNDSIHKAKYFSCCCSVYVCMHVCTCASILHVTCKLRHKNEQPPTKPGLWKSEGSVLFWQVLVEPSSVFLRGSIKGREP